MYSLLSYNCHNIKSNYVYIQELLKENEIVFICEHWLAVEEEYILKDIFSEDKHQIIFEADFSMQNRSKGRPHGGKLWLIDKRISVLDFSRINERIHRVTVHTSGGKMHLYGIWLHFDDNSSQSFIALKSILLQLESEINEREKANENFVLMGDWNCDQLRGRRFDNYFLNFAKRNGLIICDDHARVASSRKYTYKNGSNKANIDHFLISDKFFKENSVDCSILESSSNCSDHNPIKLVVSRLGYESMLNENVVELEEKSSFHRFKWNEAEFVKAYNKNLRQNFESYNDECIKAFSVNKDTINNVYNLVCNTLIKSARKAEDGMEGKGVKKRKKRKLVKRLCRDNPVVLELKEGIEKLTKECSNSIKNGIKISLLKRKLRNVQNYTLREHRRKNISHINSLMCTNIRKFWNVVTSSKKKGSCTFNKSLSLERFGIFYQKLFSTDKNKMKASHRAIRRAVQSHHSHVSKECFQYEVSEFEIKFAIKNLKKNKSPGVDNVVSEMLINASCDELISLLRWLISSIMNTGLIPAQFNTSMLTPIPKSKSGLNEPSDFRPISVSSCIANLYEMIILNNISIGAGIHLNQFGYRMKTSCKHAYFMVNEVIQYYNQAGSEVYIASLDAQKAFDRLWRDGLFYKLIGKIPDLFWRAIYNYYEQSKIIVKYDGKKSDPIDICEGVKQGGILSPYLFNFFINDLLTNCTELGVGCSIQGINLSTIAYCDDIMLLSPTASHLKCLLKVCEDYGNEWLITFNAKKSVVLKLGKNGSKLRKKDKFLINDDELSHVDDLVYLGLPIGGRNAIEEYWENKLNKVVKAFYSLHSIGCGRNGLDAITQARVYKTYCQPIFTYGLEMLHIRKCKLNEYDSSQATLIKRAIGLSKFDRSTALLAALKIEKLMLLYYKYKILFLSQIRSVSHFNTILGYLDKYYSKNKPNERSFLKQLDDVSRVIGCNVKSIPKKEALDMLSRKFEPEVVAYTKEELLLKIRHICKMMFEDSHNRDYYKDILRKILGCTDNFT